MSALTPVSGITNVVTGLGLVSTFVATGALPDGRIAVAWHSASGQFLSVLAADGTLVTTFSLDPGSTEVRAMELAVLPDGTVGVAWVEGSPPNLFLRTVDPSGNLSPLRDLGLAAGASDFGPRNSLSIQPDGTGGFVVAYGPVEPLSGGPDVVVIRRVDAAGNTMGGPVDVLPGRGDPSFAVLPDGRLALAVETASGDVQLLILNADGTTAVGPITASASTMGLQSNPSLAVLADGRFIVVWDDENTALTGGTGNLADIRGQIFTSAGVKVGSEFLVNTTVDFRQGNAVVLALADGGFVVAWFDIAASGGGSVANEALRMRAYHGNGTPRTGEVTVETGDQSNIAVPDLAELPDGRIVIAWGSNVGGAVRAQIWDPRIPVENDTIGGAPGDDTYTVDSPGDVIMEGPNAGTDLIRTALSSLSLAGFANIENLTGTSDDGQVLTGNALANTITGAAGDDVLNGGAGNDTLRGNGGDDILTGGTGDDRLDGGTGEDVMRGGAGNDVYIVDSLGDVVTEAAGGGADTIVTSLSSYSLLGLPEVEDLVATAAIGVRFTGNAGNNMLTGHDANDVLLGREGNDNLLGHAGQDTLDGGTGADTMIGGVGNDRYYVDQAGDVVTELSGEGTDTVYASVSHTLAAEVEGLVLLGTDDLWGWGNALNNALTGNSGANRLAGGEGNDLLDGRAGADTLLGGAGRDSLMGGEGADSYVLDLLPGPGEADLIYGFEVGVDRLAISASAFGGGLVEGAGVSLVSAATPRSTGFTAGVFLYDTDDGRLFFDADGAGAGASVLVVQLRGAPVLQVADFTIIA